MSTLPDKTAGAFVEFAQAAADHDFSDLRGAFRQRLVDTVGCALGALSSPPAKAARAVACEVVDSAGARIWGTGSRASVQDAAFANGVAARYLDFNDAFRGSVDVGHPADNLPALVALAEQQHSSGRELLRAAVVAYQAQIAMSNSIPLNDRGWDQPTAVVISSALGASCLLGLSPERAHHALSLAIVPHMAMHETRCGELSMWKGGAAPMGASHGVHAALLAAAGMDGPAHPFEGKNGFWAQFGQRCELPALWPADVWGLQQSNIKTWPVRDSCQIGIDAAIDLLRSGADVGSISKIFVETYKSSYRWAVQDTELWAPQTRETADHSLPFSVAVTLIDGRVTPETFENERFLDRDVLDLIGRMEVVVNEDFSSQTPGTKNCRITATETSGREVVAHVRLTQDEIDAGRPDSVIDDKFRSLAARSVSEDRAESILTVLSDADQAADISTVVDVLCDR